jgi:hypothetical protein
MHSAIAKLISLGGEPLAGAIDRNEADHYLGKWGERGQELAEMLDHKNGCYAFDGALLIRPFQRGDAPLGIVEWNDESLWRNQYVEDLAGALFFAEDLFGGQFCIRDGEVWTFEPETGAFEQMSPTIGDWGLEILADSDLRTGRPLADEWRTKEHALQTGRRLLPKRPFVLEGKYEIDNLYSIGDVEGMRFRASIANQIRDVPDGSTVEIKLVPPEQSKH